MKLLESPFFERINGKRKCTFDDENDRISKRFLLSQKVTGADVIQENLQQQYFNTGVTTLATSHCKKYPISGAILDGISPWHHNPLPTQTITYANTRPAPRHIINNTNTEVKKTPCARCLSGESGHWRHIQ